MKITIDSNGFRDAFARFGRQNQFSSNGLQALFTHLDNIERDGGGEIELDVVSLCCDFTEFTTALEAANELGNFTANENLDQQERDRQALQWLCDERSVLLFDGGVIVQNF